MQKTNFIILCFFITINCASQQTTDKNYLSIFVGPSIPVGNFANRNLDNNSAGFAKVGEQVNISYDHKVGKYFGVSAMLYGQRNAINTNALADGFSQKKYFYPYSSSDPNAPPPPLIYTTYTNWKFDKHAWLLSSFILGGNGIFPLKGVNNFSFITKAMVGIAYVSSPKLNGNSTSNTTMAHIEENSVSAFGFSYLLSGGVRYNTAKKINLLLCVNYFGTNNIKFHNITTSFSSVQYSNTAPLYASQNSFTANGKQTIQTINVNFGIELRL